MNSDGDEIGVYLTSQKELEEHRRNQRNDNRNTQYFYEKEYEGEWDIPDSTPLPRQESDNGIYLTEMPNIKKDQNIIQLLQNSQSSIAKLFSLSTV